MIDFQIDNRVAFVTMQNSKKLNCLSTELCNELRGAIHDAYEQSCCAIVLKAETRNGVWSAGHDINELPLDGTDPLAFNVPMEQLMHDIQDVPIPVIAYVEGTVWGGASDLCLSCDMIVASYNASFAITPAKIGIPYNASGIMHFIRQIGPNKAREMFFTAQPLTAAEALNVGMVNHVTSIAELPEILETKILNPLRQNSIIAISAIKNQFRLLNKHSVSLTTEEFELLNAWRNRVYNGPDYKEGIHSFLEKRKPNFVTSSKDLPTPFE
ncbi:MAG: methylmalonyl-CoA decarboxylase [Muribaculaceae bacterium]|mgnify:CR=1 FL=1|nr:methylmalonyl-CoA decarboxylase [Muribaculaceae bacterium]